MYEHFFVKNEADIYETLPNNLVIHFQKFSGHCWLEIENISGNARRATKRKIHSFCMKHGLYYTQYGYILIYSNKDINRLKDLLQYISGRRFAKTARNNNGKRTW